MTKDLKERVLALFMICRYIRKKDGYQSTLATQMTNDNSFGVAGLFRLDFLPAIDVSYAQLIVVGTFYESEQLLTATSYPLKSRNSDQT